jgi:hypothetical protein
MLEILFYQDVCFFEKNLYTLIFEISLLGSFIFINLIDIYYIFKKRKFSRPFKEKEQILKVNFT